MNVKQYRAQAEAELAAGAAATTSATSALAGEGPETDRVRVLEGQLGAGGDQAATIQELIAILADSANDRLTRLAALVLLKRAEFTSEDIRTQNVAFVSALRQAAKDDVVDLSTLALETLAVRKDQVARQMLFQILDGAPSTVPTAKAIELLSYDDHNDVAPRIRDFLATDPDAASIEQSLRVLGADPASADVFERLVKDKANSPAIRAMSATGLHSADPDRFASLAKTLLDDPGESEDLKATALGALTHFGQYENVRQNKALAKRVDKMAAASQSSNLKTAAANYLARVKSEASQ